MNVKPILNNSNSNNNKTPNTLEIYWWFFMFVWHLHNSKMIQWITWHSYEIWREKTKNHTPIRSSQSHCLKFSSSFDEGVAFDSFERPLVFLFKFLFLFLPFNFFSFFFWLIWDGFIVVAVVVTLVIVENIGISVWWAATRKCIYQMWMVNRSTTNNKMRIKCRKIGWQYQTHHSQIHFNVGFFSRCILKIVFCFCYSTCGVREKCFDRNRSAIKRTKWFTATTTLSTTITTKRWSFEHQSY